MTPAQRQEILDDEFVRAKPPGVRLVSTGIIKLAQKLRLNLLLSNAEKAEITPDRAAREAVAMVWLLDERHTLQQIKERADIGAQWVDSEELDQYDFELDPLLLLAVQREIQRTFSAIYAAQYEVESKASPGDGAKPKGNS